MPERVGRNSVRIGGNRWRDKSRNKLYIDGTRLTRAEQVCDVWMSRQNRWKLPPHRPTHKMRHVPSALIGVVYHHSRITVCPVVVSCQNTAHVCESVGMPFTHANTSDYSAPQTQEAASCGHKQCDKCNGTGNISSTWWNRPVVYKCRRCNGLGYIKVWVKVYQPISKSRKKCVVCGSDLDGRRRVVCSHECRSEKRRSFCRGWRARALTPKQKHAKCNLICARKKRNYDRRVAKKRESNGLAAQFGTAKIPASVKKINAFRNIGRLAVAGKVPRQEIRRVVNHINHGRTYEAYRFR